MHYAGARYYMSALGRWNGPDPLSHLYPKETPYSFVLGNPVGLADPTGMYPRTTGLNNVGGGGEFGDRRGILRLSGITLITIGTLQEDMTRNRSASQPLRITRSSHAPPRLELRALHKLRDCLHLVPPQEEHCRWFQGTQMMSTTSCHQIICGAR